MASIPSVKLNNGLSMPIFGLGTWQSKPGEVSKVVKEAIDVGYRHIDGAYIYQNEPEVGEAIEAKIKDGTVKREDLYVVSKLWNTKHHPSAVKGALKKTLSDLKLDYLDLYLIHWPMAYADGAENFPKDSAGKPQYMSVDYVDTWKVMEECVREGLVKSIGVSNFNKHQIERVLASCTIKPVTNQVEVHPYFNQKQLVDFCASKNIVVTGYSPLGSPIKPWSKPGDPKLLDDDKLQELAKKYSKTPAQLVLRWLTQCNVVAIPKTVNKNRLVENMSIFDFKLDDVDLAYIDSFHRPDGRGGHMDYSYADNEHWPFHAEF